MCHSVHSGEGLCPFGVCIKGVCLQEGLPPRGICIQRGVCILGVCILGVCIQRGLPPRGIWIQAGLPPGGSASKGSDPGRSTSRRICLLRVSASRGGSASWGSASRGSASKRGLSPGGLHWGGADPPRDTWDTTGYSQQIGRPHPTGMFSCCHKYVLCPNFRPTRSPDLKTTLVWNSTFKITQTLCALTVTC